jgi:hypothetical protein
MRKLFFVSLIALLAACDSKDEATPTAPANDNFDASTATLLRSGTWMGSNNYGVSGSAQIYESNGQNVLVLDGFQSSNGPDLHVYLSTSTGASSFVNLGKLKSTSGRQVYNIPAQTDLAQFKFALIWCQEFAVLFGKAETN